MDDFGRVMKKLPDTVTAKIAHNAVALTFGMALYGVADIAHCIARFRLFDAQHQAFIRYIDEPARLERHIADQKHPAGIAVPAINDHGNVDVDDVAVLECLVGWNAVADDVVDRNAAGMRITAIADRCRHSAGSKDEIAHPIIEVERHGTGHDMRHQHVERRSGESPGATHPGKAGLTVQTDGTITHGRGGIEDRDIVDHRPAIIGRSPVCHSRARRYAARMSSPASPDRFPPKRVWTAALVIIGDEILSGRTQDKNIAQIASWLNVQGIRLAEVRVVPDIEESIVEAVNILRARNDYLFTTGGIGPTHDDITVDSIARALDVGVVHHPDAVAVLTRYYEGRGGVTEARLRMARVPEGADLIPNRMSGAPGIRIANIFIMAGVPHITAGMLDALTGTLEGGDPVISVTLGAWVAESEVAGLLRDAERAHEGCSVGSYPFFREGRVGANFVCRSTDAAAAQACSDAIAAALTALGHTPVSGGI